MSMRPLPWLRHAGTAVEAGWLSSGTGFIGASWFPPAGRSSRQAAVLIVPGIAHEERTMNDGLAALARSLAGAGFGSLLIDLHGTAQSSGRLDAADIGERWRQDIRSAHDHLRAGGFEAVIVVGVRVGALLAQAALQGEHLAGFVAWAPVHSGRRHVRELKMLKASGAVTDGDAGENPGGVSIAGHDIPKAVLACLSGHSFDLSGGAAHRPMLVLGDGDKSQGAAAPPADGVDLRQAAQVQRWLFSPADAPILPHRDIRTVVHWCGERDPGGAMRSMRREPSLLKEISLLCDGLAVRERAVRIGPAKLSAVISEPLDRRSTGAVRLLATLVGPGRIFPAMARADAARGKTALRFDFAGFSTSGRRANGSGGDLYSSRNREDVAAAVDHLRRLGHPKVSLVGFCAGAWAMVHAGALPGVSGIVGINVALYRQPDYRLGDVALRAGHPVSKALSLLRGFAPLRKSVDRLERHLPPGLETGRWLHRLDESDARPLFVYSTDDPGLRHLDRRVAAPRRAQTGARLDAKPQILAIGRHAGLGHLLEGGPARARALADINAYLADVDARLLAQPTATEEPAAIAKRPPHGRGLATAPESSQPSQWGMDWAHSR